MTLSMLLMPPLRHHQDSVDRVVGVEMLNVSANRQQRLPSRKPSGNHGRVGLSDDVVWGMTIQRPSGSSWIVLGQ